VVQNGRIIAILGSGIRVIHPCSNSKLVEQIISKGALVSGFHPNTSPRVPQLIPRDRISSGLSKGVIIVEADVNSGSLDTAGKAIKQGRLIYPVPGSTGTDQLIENGAC
jgi:DNA processing protein